MPATLGLVLGVVTVDVVVDVPAPARRRAGTVVLLARTVVVAVVTGRDGSWSAGRRRHGGGRSDGSGSSGSDGSCLGGGRDGLCNSGRRCCSHPCHGR